MADDAPESLCNCLAVRAAARRITQLYDDELAPFGLRATQYTVLARLARLGPTTVQSLADSLVMDRSTLGHNLIPLQRAKLVSATPDEDDRRVRRLDLTPLGRRKHALARDAWRRAQDRLHAGYGEEAAADLRRRLFQVASLDFA